MTRNGLKGSSLAFYMVLVAIAVAGIASPAFPFDDGGKGPEIRAILDCVRRDGELSDEHAQELLKFLKTDAGSLHALVAYVVGESQGDDEELCNALAKVRPRTMQDCFAQIAFLKKKIRRKSGEQRIAAFRGMLESEITILQIEAAKEIARIDPKQGMMILEELTRAGDRFVQSEAARVLHHMGGADPGSLRIRHMYFHAYIGIVTVIEGRDPWEKDRFSRGVVGQLRSMIAEVREQGCLSEANLAKVLPPFGRYSRFADLAGGVILGECREELPTLRGHLENQLVSLTPTGMEYAFVRTGLLKNQVRDKPVAARAAAFMPLTEDPNPYLRAEAAKEIARIDPEKGMEFLKELLQSDKHVVVRGEAARTLDKMGEKTELGAAYQHMYNYEYTAVLRIIEGESLWMSGGDGELRMAAGLTHMRKPDEPRHQPFPR